MLPTPSVIVETLEERWTPTTIQTAFAFRSLPRTASGDVSIDFPVLNLGWTFSLSLTPEKPKKVKSIKRVYNWTPAALSFRHHSSRIRWENTTIQAQLSLAVKQPRHLTGPQDAVPQAMAPQDEVPHLAVPPDAVPEFEAPRSALPQDQVTQIVVPTPQCVVPQNAVAQNAYDDFPTTSIRAGECAPHNSMGGNMIPLATINIALVDTPSLESPLRISSTISSLETHTVWLTVAISNCPLPNGLFGARFGLVDEAEVHAQLVRQSGDHVLSQSLATGRLFNVKLVKFLTPSTRSASGNTGEPLPTYASLTVLEEHINLSSSVLRQSWTDALAALDNAGAKHDQEISCPDDYEYELDSDLEDEDGASSPPYDSGSERDLATPEESCTERSSSSLSFFESVEEASDQELVDNQLEELIKDARELPSEYEQTIWVKFAAHRTWHAFLWYCYTGNLKFGKLRSQVELGVRHLRVTPLEGGPPACSPKSMYRLADLVGDKDLKAKALRAIKESMTEANILDETFSVFTSRYPDVQKVQLGVLMQHYKSSTVKKAFLRAMGKLNTMPHAEPMLSAFYDKLAG